MAKCLYFHRDNFQDQSVQPDSSTLDLSFLQDNVRVGENLLNLELHKLADQILDVANQYLVLEQSANNEDIKLDCVQIQDLIQSNLTNLEFKISTLTDEICKSTLQNYYKHRYFILLSSDIIDKLKKMLQTVGRLSEIDLGIFLEERRKPLISPESTTLHAITFIWSKSINIMDLIQEKSKIVFSEDCDFLDDLDCTTSSIKYAKILLMDLTLVSFILYNHLAKLEDLKKGTPFLCPCQTKVFHSITEKLEASWSCDSTEILVQNLITIMETSDNDPLLTDSIRTQDIIPVEPCFKDSTPENLACFVFWHLFGLNKQSVIKNKDILSKSLSLRDESFEIALTSFISSSQEKDIHLSPVQEEKLKLLLLIVNWWVEKDSSNLKLITKVLDFIDTHWQSIGNKYLEKTTFRVNGLTIFQMLTNLINQVNPIYSRDGNMAEVDENQTVCIDKKNLRDSWDRILEHMNKPQKIATTEKPQNSDCRQLE